MQTGKLDFPDDPSREVVRVEVGGNSYSLLYISITAGGSVSYYDVDKGGQAQRQLTPLQVWRLVHFIVVEKRFMSLPENQRVAEPGSLRCGTPVLPWLKVRVSTASQGHEVRSRLLHRCAGSGEGAFFEVVQRLLDESGAEIWSCPFAD